VRGGRHQRRLLLGGAGGEKLVLEVVEMFKDPSRSFDAEEFDVAESDGARLLPELVRQVEVGSREELRSAHDIGVAVLTVA